MPHNEIRSISTKKKPSVRQVDAYKTPVTQGRFLSLSKKRRHTIFSKLDTYPVTLPQAKINTQLPEYKYFPMQYNTPMKVIIIQYIA